MNIKELPLILQIIPSVLNYTKHSTIGNMSPITYFQFSRMTIVEAYTVAPPETSKTKSLNEAKPLKLLNTER